MIPDQGWVANMLELQKKSMELLKNNPFWSQGLVEAFMKSGWPFQQDKRPGPVSSFLAGESLPLGFAGSQEEKELPHLNITESDRDITVCAFIPGIKKEEDISLRVKGDTLFITGKTSRARPDTEKASPEAFSRAVRLPAEADPTGSTAFYRNQYLTVRLLKKGAQGFHNVDVRFY